MSTSDFNLLRLEALRNLLQITEGQDAEEGLEISNPAGWVRAIIHRQGQAESDMRHLLDLCDNTVDRTDRRIRGIERAYYALQQGANYVYERMQAQEEIAEEWVRSELMVAANAYQTFTRQIWEVIIERTQEAEVQRMHQQTQVTRMHDAIAFLGEANIARNQHFAVFQGNVEKWAEATEEKVQQLEGRLAKAQNDIKKVAT